MFRPLPLLLVATLATGCHRQGSTNSHASEGVRDYVAALRAKDPHRAYGMLSNDARKKMSFDEFALQWKQTEAERDDQATRLETSLKGNPAVGERALMSFPDGKLVQLELEGTQWRLESMIIAQSRATRPRDAIRLFADAIQQRDVVRIMAVLTQRRRDGIQRQVEGFINGIGKHINEKVEESGSDKAELRWDEGGIRYRIVLRKEDSEWRIDDIYVRPAPKEDGGSIDDMIPEE